MITNSELEELIVRHIPHRQNDCNLRRQQTEWQRKQFLIKLKEILERERSAETSQIV